MFLTAILKRLLKRPASARPRDAVRAALDEKEGGPGGIDTGLKKRLDHFSAELRRMNAALLLYHNEVREGTRVGWRVERRQLREKASAASAPTPAEAGKETNGTSLDKKPPPIQDDTDGLKPASRLSPRDALLSWIGDEHV